MMRVLVGCECSGAVRDAFLRLGFDAMSCDLYPSDVAGPHYTGDVFDVIDYPWDLAILFPPCTMTAVSGAKHFKVKKLDGRQQRAVSFFCALLRRTEHIKSVALEQPVSIMSTMYRPPDQIIQPHQFGHPVFKTTCLWLKNLPRLKPANQLVVPKRGTEEWKAWNTIHNMAPSPDRAKNRSKTFPGIAEAFAQQWSNRLL